ncbi:MAG: cobyric acid synthase, partial [Alphaproteobacteria bacterium]|nr:cobyric acid synthase [Alphaproteobacteria bacterium]
MNPVLLKPQSQIGAQVVVQGRMCDSVPAEAYHKLKPKLLPKVLESFAQLAETADLILVEGAGSPAEVNLRRGDIANMGFAQAAGVPVLLIGDIDRGGVIAQLVGTWELLNPDERSLLRGYVINKFRGDRSLFDAGLRVISQRTGLPSLGVLPHLPAAAALPAEDGMAIGGYRPRAAGAIRIAVPVLRRLANFDDLDPLRAEPDVRLEMLGPDQPVPGDTDLVILAGSKATLADLAYLRQRGWDVDILAHRRRGGRVLGICGGYQMLGRTLRDDNGIEGPPGAAEGLGLLDLETELTDDKVLREAVGTEVASGAPVRGYRMHVGRTTGPDLARPMLELADGPDGARSADGLVQGCYLHGLFADDDFRRRFLATIRETEGVAVAYEAGIESALDELAEGVEAHLDLDRMWELASAG